MARTYPHRLLALGLPLVLAVGVAAPAGNARAEPAPHSPRVLHVPTAWLQPHGRLFATAGVSHHQEGVLALTTGLGPLAQVEIELSDRVSRCDECGADRADSAWLASAAFTVGAGADALFRGQPAVALSLRKSIGGRLEGWSRVSPRVAELSLVASRRLGALRLHAGVQHWAADRGSEGVVVSLGGAATRPFVGIEWTPAVYPRTTLVGDAGWVPQLAPDAIQLRGLAGWGIRYQALAWGSIELAVRHREGEGLADSTVLVRVNGAFGD